MTKDEITAKLDAAGIEYDGRLSAENLAELLPAEGKDLVTCEVLRDYWPTDDPQDRVRRGTFVDVSKDEAMDGLEAGTLRRVK